MVKTNGSRPIEGFRSFLECSSVDCLARLFLLSALCFLLCLLVWPAYGKLRDTAPAGGETGSAGEHRNSLSLNSRNLRAYLGPSILNGQAGVGLGVGWSVGKKLSLELGGVLPHQVSDYAHEASVTTRSSVEERVSARVRSYGETHLVVQVAALQTARFGLEGGLGFSLGFINNRYETYSRDLPSGASAGESHPNTRTVKIGPRVQATAHLAFTEHVSARLAVAYVRYGNTDTLDAQPYDLGFDGVVVEPALEWRF